MTEVEVEGTEGEGLEGSESLGEESDDGFVTEWWKKRGKAKKAQFNGGLVGSLFARISGGYNLSAAEKPCGEVLVALVDISDPALKKQLNETPSDFLRVDEHGALCARSESWWHQSATAPGSFAVREGYRVIAVNGIAKEAFTMDEIKGSWSSADPSADVVLTFEAGLDMRGCWGSTIDTAGNSVCSGTVLNNLAEELSTVSDDQLVLAGKGRMRIEGLKDFSVTSISVKELEAIGKMGPALLESEQRPGAQCYWSALAPICTVIAAPSNYTKSGVIYLAAQRKLELPNQEPTTVSIKRKTVSKMDLRGPKFAAGAIKRFFTKGHVWREQDAGFVKAFPSGVPVEGCGSREAVLALQLDLEALYEAGIVDYQISTQFYEYPTDAECTCQAAKQPTWPLILDTTGVGKGMRPLRLAVAVTDWFTLWEFTRNPFKKKLQPAEYRNRVLGGIFPSYFRMEPRVYDVASFTLTKSATEPAERLLAGNRVRAVRSMAWNSKCKWCMHPKLILDHVYTNAFIFQLDIDGRSSKTILDKGNFQIPAGAWGTIKGIYTAFPLAEGAEPLANETPSLAVEWDMIQPLESFEPRPVFRVFAEQVMSMPRSVVMPTTASASRSGSSSSVLTTVTTTSGGEASSVCSAILMLALSVTLLRW